MTPPVAYLLDVNVLVALAWPNHVSHRSATAWFVRPREIPFATCPITEAGFIRISMNPLVVTEHVSARAALELLDLYKARYSHTFWQDDLSLSDALGSTLALTGHRQVTDAYLLALAAFHRGVLVTLDSGITEIASPEYREHLKVIED